MTTSITEQDSLDFNQLKQDLANELKEVNGAYFCTLRGVARLLDISPSCLTDKRRLANGQAHGLLPRLTECSLDELPQSLKPLQGLDCYAHAPDHQAKVDTLLPEVVVSCVIKYYAYDAKTTRPRALLLDNMFSAIGIRQFFSNIVETQQETAITSVLHTEQPNNSQLDARLSVVKEVLDVLSSTTPEYKEKALLTLLSIV